MRIIRLNRVSSTNSYCKTLIEKGLVCEWDFIVASEQEAGYGKYGKFWFSPPGGVYLSAVAKDVELGSIVSPAFGLAVAKSIGDDVQLKWPNDIVYKGKKLGGILVERFKDYMIIGVGINTFDESFLKAFSHSNIITIPLQEKERRKLVEKVALNIKAIVGKLKRSKLDTIVKEWNRRAYMIGHPIMVCTGEKKVLGVFEGINVMGHLILRDSTNTVEIVNGEIDLSFYGYER